MTQENESQHSSEDLSASSAFAEALAGQVNQQDVDCMIQAQKHMMLRFEKTNEMLINCNALSTIRFHMASQEFKRHTQLLLEMKKDLDIVFRRVRNLKAKLSSQYPQAFQACSTVHHVLEEKDEEAGEIITEKETVLLQSKKSDPNNESSLKPNNSSSCSQTTTPSPTTSSSSD